LFGLITDLVKWESSNNETIIHAARVEIARSLARNRKAEGTASAQDEAVLRVPPSYGADGRYRDLSKADVAAVNRYLAEVAPPVHDPFAGGGSIPLEAQRLGLRAIATDLNPVAVLINKALIEIPPKFAGRPPVNPESRKRRDIQTWKGAQGLAEDVRYYGKWMRDEAFKRIGHLYPDVELPKEYGGGRSSAVAWLWARTVASPNPACGGTHVPLVSTFMVSTKKGKETFVEPVVEGGTYRFTIKKGAPKDASAKNGTKLARGANFRCLLSGTAISADYVRSEAQAGRMRERLMAIVADGQRGRVYLAPTDEHEAIARTAKPSWKPDLLVPTRCHDVDRLPMYGMPTWGDAFTPRQLTALTTFSDLVQEAKTKAQHDGLSAGFASDEEAFDEGGLGAKAYSESIATYLSFAISKLADRGSTICTWFTDRDSTRNTFSRNNIPMTWDFAELNTLLGGTGSFLGAVDWTAESIDGVASDLALICGETSQADAASQMKSTGNVVSTDPPYYDNIGYADLSDFFYVWLRRSLRYTFPSLFRTLAVPKSEELIASSYRHGTKDKAEKFFLDGMTDVMSHLAAQSNRHSPVTIYYAFKQSENQSSVGISSTGWETFLDAVQKAGFSVGGTWPVRTELSNRMIGSGTNALASSIVLVCRKRPADAPTIDRTTFRRLLRQELPAALRNLQKGNIAPVDMAQASIGPGMGIFSRHSKVLEADGTAMSVRTALQLINQALDEYLTEQEGEFDADTRFAVTWFETRQFEAGAYGEAETLATARNVSVAGVAEAGLLHSAGGKVRLLKREELPDDWDPTLDKRPTVWEATQHLIKRLETKGEAGAAELLAALGAKAAPARDLAYRLYTTCERKKWADEARAYNGLVVSWPEIEKLSAEPGKRSVPSGTRDWIKEQADQD
ncbi:MAG: hypothetical protein RBU45_21660, partial [Myxococcota bacterium]|nr:hypothetical protein [Myxococcota bacterium]